MRKSKLKKQLKECQKLNDDIRDLAYEYWSGNRELPYIGIYITDFGGHTLVALSKEQMEKLS